MTPAQPPVPIVDDVVAQHTDDAMAIHGLRRALCRQSHANLRRLREFDDRLRAHFDGLRIAGPAGLPFRQAAMESPNCHGTFLAAVCALEARDQAGLDRLLTLAESAPEIAEGLFDATEWIEREHLAGVAVSLLASPVPFRRRAGLVACARHRVDLDPGTARSLSDEDPGVRATALRAAGELGLLKHVRTVAQACGEADPRCSFWACWSAVLLGNRNEALRRLAALATTGAPKPSQAFDFALQALNAEAGHAVLREIRGDRTPVHLRLRGCGVVGNPAYVPWLIRHMSRPDVARTAGEAFALITGLDLAANDLEGPRPDGFDSGPSDDPDDPNVAIDPDEGCPWPDVARVSRWWESNAQRFTAGTRYFMGAPVTREHCIDVLKNGYQRQRILAPHYLCLLNPGTPLFNTSAPAWRQMKLLDRMV